MTASFADAEFHDLLPATRRALAHRIAVAQAEGRSPSLMGAVVREGELVWSGGRGAVDGRVPGSDTQYRIGSITKTFIAVLVLRLRDEGLLDLADPLRKHLDLNLDLTGAPPEAGDATVAQLLSHTAGLAAEARGPWWERTEGALRPALTDVFGEGPQPHPAGRRHHYSNPGFALLGALVERLRGGTPWHEVLRREVLEPLGMDRTTPLPEAPHADGWAVHPWADVLQPEPAVDTGLMGPAGQLWSTAGDLGRFAAFLLHGDERVLSAETLAKMREPASGPEGEHWDGGYGLGVQLIRSQGRLLFGHTGSMPGFVAALWVNAADAVAGIALANVTAGPPTGAVAADLVRIVADREPRFPRPWQPLPAADAELLALTGPWYWGATPLALRLRADRGLELRGLAGQGRASRFRAEADGTWTGLDGYYAGEVLRVVRTEAGEVSHLDIGTFVFTRQPYEPGDAAVPGGVHPEGWR
ncbi:serine hydrolase domain-containing protein [Streptomyces sp. NPDC050610]|uniref:serine hydrolase domain-containing protein n=1 Tax=Streptomyces sp. NPDC050610 TaxID=3157097 RepID=UPI0034264715